MGVQGFYDVRGSGLIIIILHGILDTVRIELIPDPACAVDTAFDGDNMIIGRFHLRDILCDGPGSTGGNRQAEIRIFDDGILIEQICAGGDQGLVCTVTPVGDPQLLRIVIHVDNLGADKERITADRYRL